MHEYLCVFITIQGVHGHLWRTSLGITPGALSILFLKQVLSLTQVLLTRLGRLAREPQGSACLCSQRLRSKGCTTTLGLFYEGLGTEKSGSQAFKSRALLIKRSSPDVPTFSSDTIWPVPNGQFHDSFCSDIADTNITHGSECQLPFSHVGAFPCS